MILANNLTKKRKEKKEFSEALYEIFRTEKYYLYQSVL